MNRSPVREALGKVKEKQAKKNKSAKKTGRDDTALKGP
jgi:hypothetical protein